MKAKIKFIKGPKVIGIYNGRKYIGSISIDDFMEFINNKDIDIEEFIKF